jgi:hypothetical protein
MAGIPIRDGGRRLGSASPGLDLRGRVARAAPRAGGPTCAPVQQDLCTSAHPVHLLSPNLLKTMVPTAWPSGAPTLRAHPALGLLGRLRWLQEYAPEFPIVERREACESHGSSW